MLIRKPPDIQPAKSPTSACSGAAGSGWRRSGSGWRAPGACPGRLPAPRNSSSRTPYDAVTGYNNFYEFGTGKEDPAENADTLKPRPWSISVEGEVKKPATYWLDDLFKGMKPEERVYRMRCVEAWSMVVPWLGYPLRDVIKRLEPPPRPSTSSSPPCSIRSRCRASARDPGLAVRRRACGWTKRCTRSRC